MQKIKKHIESLKRMVELYPDGAVEILKGNVSYSDKEKFNILETQYMFKYFIKYIHELKLNIKDSVNKDDIVYNNHIYDIINNASIVFIKLFNKKYYLKRKEDLTPKEYMILSNLMNLITKFELMKNGYSDTDMNRLFEYRTLVCRYANMYGIYDKFERNKLFINERRKDIV